MDITAKRLMLAGLILGAIGSVDIEAAYLRGLWPRTVSAARNSKLFGNYKKLGLGATSTGSVVYGFWPFSKSKQQNSEQQSDQWKRFDFETWDIERSYLGEYIRSKRKHHSTAWNIYYGFPTINERFGPKHPHMRIATKDFVYNKETRRHALPSVNINMAKCKIYKGMGTDSRVVRVACKEHGDETFFDYLFQPVTNVYDDQRKEVMLESRQDIKPQRLINDK